MKTVQEINDELSERFGSYCLDDDYEREEIARYIHEQIRAANGFRAPSEEVKELHLLVRFHDPDFYSPGSKVGPHEVWEGLCQRFPFCTTSTIEVLPLETRPFLDAERDPCYRGET